MELQCGSCGTVLQGQLWCPSKLQAAKKRLGDNCKLPGGGGGRLGAKLGGPKRLPALQPWLYFGAGPASEGAAAAAAAGAAAAF